MQFRFPNLGKLAIAKFGVIVSTVVIACLMFGMTWAQDGAANVPAVPAAAPAPVTENMLVKTWNSLGTMYAIVFLIMSIILVALVVRAILAVQKNNFVPDDLVQGVETSLGEKNPQAAVELVRADESFLGVVLSAGLEKMHKGKEAVLEAMQIAGDSETMRVEHLLSYIALIGNIAPMVGLLGTVQGMVASFGTIASSAQTPKPNELANGIEQALYTTLVGLYLAIPAIAIYNILRNTVQRRIMTAGTKSEEIMEQFQALSK
ncbi:MAG: MotA/TolQ/ExbB proton channel family protein [Planctomycetota bacterium]|jgi:biopolymer transport protein ExbB